MQSSPYMCWIHYINNYIGHNLENGITLETLDAVSFTTLSKTKCVFYQPFLQFFWIPLSRLLHGYIHITKSGLKTWSIFILLIKFILGFIFSWKFFYCSHSACGCPLLFYCTGKQQVRKDSTNRLHYIQKCQEISFKSYYQRYFPVWPKAILLIPALEPGARQWNIYRKMYMHSPF